MATTGKKNVLTIILIVLIVLNIAALITFVLWPHHMNPVREKIPHNKHHRADFLKNELQLNDQQSESFELMKKEQRDTLKAVALLMKDKRNQLSIEMMKAEPDSTLLFTISDEIGVLYAGIRKLNVMHYLKMKSICNDEQKRKLDTVFKGIFCCDDPLFERFHKDKSQKCKKNMKQHSCNQ